MKKGEKRKQDLLDIAYRMFLTKGYENTSIDGIIEEAGIAKGTFYYYFKTKEQMLEEVIGQMLDRQEENAKAILGSGMPIPQKIVGIVASFRPEQTEEAINEALHRPENSFMHEKTLRSIVERAVPILTEVAEEGIKAGIFSCNNVTERVKLILLISNSLFNDDGFTERDVEVFIDTVEKILGAGEGTMGFITELIKR